MEFLAGQEKMVFCNVFDGREYYSIGLSKKDRDGNYENGYMPIQFRNGVRVTNQTRIVITKAWLSFYKDKNNKTVPYIFVSDFTKLEEGQLSNQFETITDSDLPF